MKKFSRILQYLSKYKGKLLLYLVFTLLSTGFGLVSLGMLSPFMDILFRSGTAAAHATKLNTHAIGSLKDFIEYVIARYHQNGAMIVICLLIIATTLMKNVFYYWSSYISSPIRSATVTFLRNDVYEKILALPIGYFTERRKGDLISRMTNDIYEIESSVVSTLEGLIKDPLTIIGYLAYMIYLSPTLSLFLLILLPITGFLIGRISRTLKRQSQSASVKMGESLSVLDETLGGIRIIKGFGAERLLKNKFLRINDDLFHIRNKMNFRRDLASPLTETLGVVILSIILYYGGRLVLDHAGARGALPPGDLISYIATFGLLINPAKNLSTSIFNMQRGAAAMERVEELLKAPVTIIDRPDAKKLGDFSDKIEFRGVGFSYEEATILENIDLVIEKGKTVALVGSSGAGKSTLADLVPRFHDVSKGELLIDGVNIKQYSLSSVREQMSIVTQEPILFNDTIAANIALGAPDATIEEIMEAARIANAHEFIMRKEEGYQTNIGDRGNKLSGGEKQRLTIARALLKNPPILILDEATSSLDTESERLVQDAINKMMQHRTSIVIAHRLSTIRHADEIIVLQKGLIVERGTHDDLIGQQGFYRKLVEMQEVK